MKVVLAKTAGFCWGVRRAMDAVLEASTRGGGPVQTLGPLIHNPQALELIGRRGVTAAPSPEAVEDGTVVIRAHGIPIQDLRDLKERAKEGKLEIVNATCPEVAKVHSRIKRWSPKGYFTVILGLHGHAESVAHRSFADHGSIIVANLEEAKALTDEQLRKVLVVAQTTFTLEDFQEISEFIRAHSQDCIIENTICADTWTRQGEAEQITAAVDAVVVVGGKNSANTKHLVELAERRGRPVQYIETAAELDMARFRGDETVGVLAGASTPTWLVEEVVDVLEQHGKGPGFAGRAYQEVLGTPLLLALGAGAMSLGTLHWLGMAFTWQPPLAAVGYVLAMYLLAPFVDPSRLSSKGPAEARVLARHRGLLLGLGACSLITALGTGATIGHWAFLTMAGASILGLLYARRLVISRFVFSLRSIPGSKEVLVALALALVIVVLPVQVANHTWDFRVWAAMVFTASLAFARTTIHNLRDMQNDRILGLETLPILIGRGAAKKVMQGVLGLGGVLVVLAGLQTPTLREGLAVGLMLLAAAYPLLHWWLYHERFSAGHSRFRPPLELSFFIAGLVALL